MIQTSTPKGIVANVQLTGDLVARYLAAKKDVGLAPKTLRGYAWFLEWLARDYHELPVDPGAVYRSIKSRGGKAPDSLKTSFRTVRTFYRWLIKQGLLDAGQDPFLSIERPQGKTPVPRVLSLQQLRQLLDVSNPPYNRALILTLLDTACRIGELQGRNKDHLTGGTLELFGKTGGRLVPVSPEVAGYLLELPTYNLFPPLPWRGIASGAEVVDRPALADSLGQRVERLLHRSGLRGRKLGPHLLRHSAATSWVNNGGDLKSLSQVLGHTSTRMSERYVTLAMDTLGQKQAQHGVLRAIVAAMPAVPPAELPRVELPPEVAMFPLDISGSAVRLFLGTDRRKHHTYFYIKARKSGSSGRLGARSWAVCSLGPDLPINIVDAYRQAVDQENRRRQELSKSARLTR